jgi:N-methylhydantoinase A/oxoprolinase/acetone carboxylase beta subunit
MNPDGKIYIGVDIGGTFTDVVAYDEASGEWRIGKVLTSPESPEKGVIDAIGRVIDPSERARTALVAHATTLGINAVIQRTGARTGLLVTQGFTDLLYMGTGQRYDIYELFPTYAVPLVAHEDIYPVAERLTPAGEVLLPVAAADVAQAIDKLLQAGVQSIAVCLLHSYANSAHEQQVERAVNERAPDIPVSISSAVSPEIREYSRLCTTVANAYIRPLIGRYLSALQSLLRAEGHHGQLVTMLSDAGMVAPQAASRNPVRILESGSAAGSVLAEAAARNLSMPDLLLFDMGGTTAKISTVLDGVTRRSTEFEVARVHRFKAGSGIPLRTPVVDLIEIGAGGGSIARIDDRGLIAVGPESSGAEPGPACYGQGGGQATVTDADVVLGYVDPARFLGGEMPLDVEAARGALARLGEPLQLNAEDTAKFVHSAVNASMAGAARVYLAERGLEAAALSMLAIGGAGPVHAIDLAREVGVAQIVVPRDPSTGSAIGLVTAPLAFEVSRSAPRPVSSLTWQLIGDVVADLREQARGELMRAGAQAAEVVETVAADMHLEGQSHEIAVTIEHLDSGDAPDALNEAFGRSYFAAFGRAPLDRPVYVKTWRLRASAPAPGPSRRDSRDNHASSRAGIEPSAARYRAVYFSEAGRYVRTLILDRDALEAGEEFIGPVVIEERLSSTVAGPRCRVKVLDDLSLLIDIK